MTLSAAAKAKPGGSSSDLVAQAAERLQDLSESLSDVVFKPYVWCEFDNVGDRRLVERVKFNILEIQENFENFVDKKDYSLDVRNVLIGIHHPSRIYFSVWRP